MLTDADVWGKAAPAAPAPDLSYGTDGTNVGNPISNFFKDWRYRADEALPGLHAYGAEADAPTAANLIFHGAGLPNLNDLRGAGAAFQIAAAPFMAAYDQVAGRPAAIGANLVNDATGIAPGYVADPHKISDVTSVVSPLGEAAATNRAISTGAKAAGITEEAFMARQAAQQASADAAARAAAAAAPRRASIFNAPAAAVSGQFAPVAAAVSNGAAESQAGKRLAAAASDLVSSRQAISDAADGGVIVPGSQPTTAELTGDMRLSALQRGVAVKKPALFADRAAQQSAARTGALQDLQPDGDPMAFAQAVTERFGQLDADHAANVHAAQQAGDQAVADTTAAHDATVAGAIQQAQQAADAVGGGQTPDVTGAALRENLVSAADASKAQYGALYKAVDPSGTMVLDGSPIAQGAAAIKAGVPATAEPLGTTEAGIYDTAAQLGQNTPMSDAMAFRVRVGQAATQAKLAGDNVAAARLNTLRSSIDDALAGRVAQQVASDQQAVAAGTMAPEQAMAAKLQAEFGDWRAQRAEARATVGGTPDAGAGVGSGSAGVSGVGGAAGQAAGRPGPAAGSPGLPQDAGSAAPFDPQAADRLNEANTAFAQHQRTFGAAPVAQTLRSRGGYSNAGADFVLPDGSVPGRFWKPGPGGYDSAQALLKASPDSQPLLEDYAASTLRTDAMANDGTIDPGKFATWKKKYGDAIRALPPETQARFADAASASDALAEAAANRTAAIKATQADAAANVLKATKAGQDAIAEARKTAPAKFLGRTEPEDVTSAVGSILGGDNAVARMGQLAAAARDTPSAMSGLQRATVDHLVGRMLSETEAGTTGVKAISNSKFQTYLARNRAALGQVLDDATLNRLKAIADDISRSRRSENAAKLAGGSNTAQDQAGTLHQVVEHLSQTMLTTALALGAGHEGGAHGAIGGLLLGGTLHALRSVGTARVDSLITQAALDPEVFMRLTAKLPKNAAAAQRAYPNQLGSLVRALAVSQGLSQRQRRPSDQIPQR